MGYGGLEGLREGVVKCRREGRMYGGGIEKVGRRGREEGDQSGGAANT